MTNEEAIELLKNILPRKISYAELVGASNCYGDKLVYESPEPYAIEYAIESLQENTKLKAEIDELKSKIASLNYENTDLKEEVGVNILWSNVVEKTLKKEIDKNTKLCEEIAELKII